MNKAIFFESVYYRVMKRVDGKEVRKSKSMILFIGILHFVTNFAVGARKKDY
ncbi:hypothetical protein [Neobacillus niacini]|uniref:hypothetical protein n=1 Tax=Neobacillus niacini TaxID=86668 RepID=UPI00286C49CC|nr:hypothetical protein [Neobacillus niacini]